MVLNMKSQSGFTLIEIVVTLSIMGLIMMTALPLTQSWVNSAVVLETKALLQQAYGRTRAIALANQAMAVADGAAVYMCVNNSKIYVQVPNPDGSLGTCGPTGSTDTRIIWAGDVKTNTTITTSTSANFVCMGLNNLGTPISNALSGTCTTDKLLTVTKGGDSNAKTLY